MKTTIFGQFELRFGLTIFFALALLWSCEKEGNGAISITGDCTDIGECSATLHGTCNLNGVEGASVVYGIEWSDTDLTTNRWAIKAETKDSKNKYSCRVTGLSANTLYYYRAYTRSDVVSYGEVKTFKTLDFTSSITTKDASEITETTALLNGAVSVSSKDDLPKECGFIISDTSIDSNSNSKDYLLLNSRVSVSNVSTDGSFSFTYGVFSEGNRLPFYLTPDTQYYYAAYVLVGGRTIFGEVKSFRTLECTASVNTMDATDITDYSAVLNGEFLFNDSIDAVHIRRLRFYYSSTASSLNDLISNGNRVEASLRGGYFSCTISGIPADREIYYVASSEIRIGYNFETKVFGDIKSFTLADVPELVDLGLSVKWRSRNVGADAPEEYGDYFAWGETETKTEFELSNYKWYDGPATGVISGFTKYVVHSHLGTLDNKTTLDPEDDVAHVKLGGNWRMPTKAEWSELWANCTSSWVNNYRGKSNGRLFTAANGNSIFIPAAGAHGAHDLRGGNREPAAGALAYYWSSSLDSSNELFAKYMFFGVGASESDYYQVLRKDGLSVRPVCDK